MTVVQDFKLPSGRRIRLIFGQRTTSGYLNILRASKTGAIFSSYNALEEHYNSMVKSYAERLAYCVNEECPELGAVVSPPSSRCDAVPYLDAIKEKRRVKDLSCHFKRKNRCKSSDSNTTTDDLIADFYSDFENLEHVKSILIVDDCLATGKTIDATIAHLRGKGLPEDCDITVAVWELIPQKSLPNADGRTGDIESGGDAEA